MKLNVKLNRSASVCLGVVGFLYALAILAPWVAPYHYEDEARRLSFCPPTPIEWVADGKLSWPFVYGQQAFRDDNERRRYRKEIDRRYPLRFFAQGRLLTVDEPGRLYLFGADSRGRDILSRAIYGARIALSIGLIGALISFVIGLLIGGLAGYIGGRLDNMLMRLCDMFMLVPGFYLMLALRSAVPENFNSTQVYLTVVVILAFIGWASLARVIRGMALSLKERPFVLSAKLLGLSDGAIIIRHILPHTASYALVAMMLTIPSYILAEAGLSLIGLGIQDPVPSWGNMLTEAMNIINIQLAPWLLIPGMLIIVTTICFNIIGDNLRDQLDPLYKRDANS